MTFADPIIQAGPYRGQKRATAPGALSDATTTRLFLVGTALAAMLTGVAYLSSVDSFSQSQSRTATSVTANTISMTVVSAEPTVSPWKCLVSGDLVGEGNPADVARQLCN